MLIGHGEGVAVIVVAGEGTRTGCIAIGGVARCCSQRQAYLVAVAGMASAAVQEASVAAVSGDVADAVGSGVATEGHGDALTATDAMHLLALGVAEDAGVVAVGDGSVNAGEGLAHILAAACQDLGLTLIAGSGGVDAVLDVQRAVLPAHKSAAVVGAVGGEQLAVEEAARDGEGAIILNADEAAVGAVAIYTAADDDAAAAVRDGGSARCMGSDARSILGRCFDGSGYVQVPDGGTVHVGEGCCIFGSGGVVEGQRVLLSATVEGALELMVAAACHAADLDARAEFHRLATEAVPGAVEQTVAEEVPAVGGADNVWVLGRAVCQRVVIVIEERGHMADDADGHICIGHGQRVGIAVAGKCGFGGTYGIVVEDAA